MTKKLLTEIDEAIARLQEARAFLIRDLAAANRGTKPAAKSAKTSKKSAKNHHTLSAEARERIRQGQLRRWAVVKKNAKKAAA